MIAKAATGIIGFDELTGGGIPGGRVTLVKGGAGSGKTVMALQSLVYAARDLDERCVFVAFEEHSQRIKLNAAGFGWDLDDLPDSKLTFLDRQPSVNLIQSGSFDLGGLLAGIGAVVDNIGATRVVLDSMDVILALLPNRQAVRREVYRLHEWLLEREITAIITKKLHSPAQSLVEADKDFMEYMVDCAVCLNQHIVEGVSHRTLRVLKFRGSAFDENDVPYLIGTQGIELAVSGSEQDLPLPVSDERISSGVIDLDTMLNGGYFRNAAILITGAPGTAKTTLSGAFVEAACKRGERTLLVSFDSRVEEISRNLRSIGVDLQTPWENGLLRMESASGLGGSSEIQLMRIRKWALEHEARCVAIDPASALAGPGNIVQAQSVVKRLVDWCKRQGITLLTTSLLERVTDNQTHTLLHVSTVADTWIHLDYRSESGERNRGLSILKSRGTSHSNQVRELILSGDGIQLADVYVAGGEALMGTLRMERELFDLKASRVSALAQQKLMAQLEAGVNELETTMLSLQKSIQDKKEELHEAKINWQTANQQLENTESLIRAKRQGDTQSDE